jgi:hypothetical protein
MDEHRLKVFENRLLKEVIGPERAWRKLRNEDL